MRQSQDAAALIVIFPHKAAHGWAFGAQRFKRPLETSRGDLPLLPAAGHTCSCDGSLACCGAAGWKRCRLPLISRPVYWEGSCTALHKAAGAAYCPASFYEQSSNLFLLSQPFWALSVVFVSAAGQQQPDGWGCMAVNAMRWTLRLPCDWACTECFWA